MKITPKTMAYWKQTKSLFKEKNLNFIPAIHRIEYKDGVAVSLDATKKPGICDALILEGEKYVFLNKRCANMSKKELLCVIGFLLNEKVQD